jgi:hypothetical protein
MIIPGFQKSFIVDTGLRISLLQTGVYSRDVTGTDISPFGVTGDELDIKRVQEVQFHLNNLDFRHQFYVSSLPTDADGMIWTVLFKRNST